MEDAQLVAGALAGKAERYDALYVRYRGMVRSMVTGLGVPEPDADDMTQEVMSAACLKLGKFEPSRSRFSTWVCGFAKKTVVNYWRARKRHPAPDSLDELEEDCVASDKDGPAVAHERKLVQQEVRDLVCRLKPKLREPVILYWFKELTIAEIARLLGRPDSTVRGQLKEALRDLRALMADDAALRAGR